MAEEPKPGINLLPNESKDRGISTSEGKGFYAMLAALLYNALGITSTPESIQLGAMIVGAVLCIGYAAARSYWKIKKDHPVLKMIEDAQKEIEALNIDWTAKKPGPTDPALRPEDRP